MTNIRIPSGLIDSNIEMFKVDGRLLGTHSGSVKDFFDLPPFFIQSIREKLHASPCAINALEEAGYHSQNAQLEKYAECNYSGFDLTADFANGALSDSEYHECGYRGVCPMEGVVCGFFKANGHVITPFEISMIKLLATEDTLPEIAEKLTVSMTTFELRKQALFQKLNVLSRARLVAVCYDLQILNPQVCSN